MGDVGDVLPTNRTVISPEMKVKILEGQRKSPNKNALIGVHSSEISNRNPNYAVAEISINSDGTRKVKLRNPRKELSPPLNPIC
ncbi:hypothetical protein [Paenibacillus dendritiformis]|uniref:hypothetical protein n=1 Tax=Paenibacillus dendritiformis TaxID=130049 RepID=UPI0011108530|nr:hypothetical protein [Paenibacillus dendritiformis]CAH8771912.1 hypothetical protein H7S4_004647 [Paenibacillus dendritiformis]